MALSLSTRKIGSVAVTAIGWGAMGLSAYYGKPKPDEERFAFLDALYASGCRNWDSADVYGDSEELLGQWFKKSGKRNEIFLATKFGIVRKANRAVNGEPEYVKAAVERSLKRLGVDYVDLYYLHRPDPTVPIERTVSAMAELVQAGKIKYLGLSEVSANDLRRAHAVHPISAYQVEYSPFCLDIERDDVGLLKTCRELGITVIAYSPLGRGLLTGRYKGPEDFEEGDFRLTIPKFSKGNFPKILTLAEKIKAIGAKYGAEASTVCIAWVLAQGKDIIPIPGTTRIQNLKENLAGMSLELSPQDLDEISTAVKAANLPEGTRYSQAGIQLCFADTPPL
ncbi:Aldo/keto reductase [Vararia minispora EC-137]|uniref:Aldo/keto reductase n=1 Tax=Vararia minispora EC-137 TaxID=1314806 RepID=A0ACB8QX66_9AGAM|nr:Aldo/keto reductase [Vararia minispora EC-137]